jgi:hypothetical protein
MGTKMMPLGVGDVAPNASVLDDAIIYAADNGARVITMSLGVGPSSAITSAVNYAYNTRGVFIDNAAGNENGPVNYPSTLGNVVAVGATDHNDNRASFSNFGPELEVAAPGVDILSTQIGNTYGTSSGTSFASPHVAGVAALLMAQNPGATNVEVRLCINTSAEDQVGNPTQDTPGKDNYYGWGRVNARDALACIGGSGGGKTYDVWISQSFASPPYAPFHDCLTLTQDSITLASCSAGGPAVVGPDVVAPLIGIIPVCGGSPLNLLFLGNTLDGTDIGFQADTIGGVIAGIDQLTTFGFEGIRNDGCFLSSGDTGNSFTP